MSLMAQGLSDAQLPLPCIRMPCAIQVTFLEQPLGIFAPSISTHTHMHAHTRATGFCHNGPVRF